MIISLLAQPATFARSGGRQYGEPVGSEFVTLPPSGTVAVVSYDYDLIPIGEHEGVEGTYVDIVEPTGDARIEGIPAVPGHYLVAAQVADAVGPALAEQLRESGIRLYTPRMLVFPGQPGHPGREVLPGPFSPGLIRRV